MQGGSSGIHEEEENVALPARGKNRKFKKGGNSGGHKEKGKAKKGEKDLSFCLQLKTLKYFFMRAAWYQHPHSLLKCVRMN